MFFPFKRKTTSSALLNRPQVSASCSNSIPTPTPPATYAREDSGSSGAACSCFIQISIREPANGRSPCLRGKTLATTVCVRDMSLRRLSVQREGESRARFINQALKEECVFQAHENSLRQTIKSSIYHSLENPLKRRRCV